MSGKPYQGIITHTRRVEFTKEMLEKYPKYPDNLGYLYMCDFLEHKIFGRTYGQRSNTSLVIREYEEDGKNWVETLNSRYIKIDGDAS